VGREKAREQCPDTPGKGARRLSLLSVDAMRRDAAPVGQVKDGLEEAELAAMIAYVRVMRRHSAGYRTLGI
jgi:hypothetical protein